MQKLRRIACKQDAHDNEPSKRKRKRKRALRFGCSCPRIPNTLFAGMSLSEELNADFSLALYFFRYSLFLFGVLCSKYGVEKLVI